MATFRELVRQLKCSREERRQLALLLAFLRFKRMGRALRRHW